MVRGAYNIRRARPSTDSGGQRGEPAADGTRTGPADHGVRPDLAAPFDGTAAIPAFANTPAQPAVPGIPLDHTRPRMLNETAAALVRHLDHPNGWWRDTAQRLLGTEAGPVGDPRAAAARRQSEHPRGAVPRALDPRRAAGARCVLRARTDEGCQPTDAGAGDSRQRNPPQSRRQISGERLSRGDHGR